MRSSKKWFSAHKKKESVILLLIVVSLCITFQNFTAERDTIKQYEMGQWVPLEDDFIFSASEAADGYSLCVKNATVYSYEDYIKKCGASMDVIEPLAQSPVLELEVAVKNEDNTEGGIPAGWFALKDKTRSLSNYCSNAYAALQNKKLEDSSGFSIRPGTEFTVYLPFTMQYGIQNHSILDETNQGPFYFVVSQYPINKEIVIYPSH